MDSPRDAIRAARTSGAILAALAPYGVEAVDVAQLLVDEPIGGPLAALREMVLELSDSLTPRGVGQWLHARNRLLAGQTPLELLARGDVAAVRAAVASFVDGNYV